MNFIVDNIYLFTTVFNVLCAKFCFEFVTSEFQNPEDNTELHQQTYGLRKAT